MFVEGMRQTWCHTQYIEPGISTQRTIVESFVPGVLLSCFFDTQESCFCLFLLHILLPHINFTLKDINQQNTWQWVGYKFVNLVTALPLYK